MKREPDRLRELPEFGLTQSIIGAFFQTYNGLGYGFLESVYRRALVRELRERHLHVLEETPVDVWYKGEVVGMYRLDILVERRVAVELKSTTTLNPTDRRQVVNYLRATKLDVGLLLHYGPEPNFHRIVSPRVLDSQRA